MTVQGSQDWFSVPFFFPNFFKHIRFISTTLMEDSVNLSIE